MTYQIRKSLAAKLRALAASIEPPMPIQGYRCSRCGVFVGESCHRVWDAWTCTRPEAVKWDDETLVAIDQRSRQ